MMNILLVDDDEVIRMGMRKLIEKSGRDWCVVGEFPDGAMALDYLDLHENTDLIICDVRMPIMDGLKLTETIREKRSYSPKIIMLSGYNDFEYVRSAFMNGACDYILKPFKKDELIALIEKVELQISEEEKSKKTHDHNRSFLIAEVIRKLSDCSREEIKDLIKRLKDLGINTSLGCHGVFRIEADQYYRQFSGQAQYNKALMDLYEIIISENTKSDELEILSGTMGKEIILLILADKKETIVSFGKELFARINDERDPDRSATMGVSAVTDNIDDIPELFKMSGEAVRGRFYLGQKQYIEFSQVEGKNIKISYDISAAADRLVHYVTLCDYMGARENIDRIFLDLSYCSEDLFRRYMHDLLEHICARVSAFGNYVSANAPEIDFCIDYLNTYRELKTYMSSLLKSAIEYIEKEKEQKSERRIEMAKDYIMVHYSEPFTLAEIADYVELNASYFSNLFKTETGMNFSEYLLNVRMDKAKELLRDPKIKIYEIGQLVGYEDAVSFGRAFKKKWGISPKEYRNLVY
jgi:two-component system response regulator YesN